MNNTTGGVQSEGIIPGQEPMIVNSPLAADQALSEQSQNELAHDLIDSMRPTILERAMHPPERFRDQMTGQEYRAYRLGLRFLELAETQSAWSQRTFGTDGERGPKGPLKHLKKEINECLDMHKRGELDPGEYGDLLILTLDSSRRAGLAVQDLVGAAIDKMNVNQARDWPAPTLENLDKPIEHKKKGGKKKGKKKRK